MWDSLQKLTFLPEQTQIYCAHEYTVANAAFALSIDPDNQALVAQDMAMRNLRTEGKPTVPTSVKTELATNPFLRANDPKIRAHLGMDTASDVEVFTEIRARKDRF